METLTELARGAATIGMLIAVFWLLGARGRRLAKMTPEQRELERLRRRVSDVERRQRWES